MCFLGHSALFTCECPAIIEDRNLSQVPEATVELRTLEMLTQERVWVANIVPWGSERGMDR